MRIGRRSLDLYRSRVDAQAAKARDFVRRSLDAWFAANPESTTAEARAFCIELLKASMPNFGDAAGTLAVDFFDEVCDAEGLDAKGRLYDTTRWDTVEYKVRYFAGKLNDGDEEGFKKQVAEATHYFVKRSAHDNMLENCAASEVAWARVPTGFETCAFCFMLASRGFVYGSETKAGGYGHSYHEHCDCCIVPGRKGRTRIDGYDPQGMADRFEMCVETIGTRDPKRVMREIETRDWHWLYTGEAPEVEYSSEKKRRETLKHRPHEDRTARRLSNLGFKCYLGADSKKSGKDLDGRTLFDGYADTASGLEFKTVLGSRNAYGAVKNYLDNSIKKKNLKRLIIDNYESEYLTDQQVADAVVELTKQDRYRETFPWISLLGKDGKLKDVVR